MVDDFGLEKTDDRLSQRVGVRVVDTANRRFGTGLGEPLREADRQVLHATVAMMHQPFGSGP